MNETSLRGKAAIIGIGQSPVGRGAGAQSAVTAAKSKKSAIYRMLGCEDPVLFRYHRIGCWK